MCTARCRRSRHQRPVVAPPGQEVTVACNDVADGSTGCEPSSPARCRRIRWHSRNRRRGWCPPSTNQIRRAAARVSDGRPPAWTHAGRHHSGRRPPTSCPTRRRRRSGQGSRCSLYEDIAYIVMTRWPSALVGRSPPPPLASTSRTVVDGCVGRSTERPLSPPSVAAGLPLTWPPPLINMWPCRRGRATV